MLKLNPEILFTVLLGTILLIVIGSFLVVFLLQYQKKKFRHKQEVLNLKEAFNNTLLQSKLEIQEQTLKNISQEIHDNIGQVLSLAKINLATISIVHEPAAMSKIEEVRGLIGKAIQDLRDLSRGINTDFITEMGLARSIENELETVRRTGLFEASFEIKGEIEKLGAQTELIIFRIVQELLNNAIKHSGASIIGIALEYGGHHFILEFADNGKGFTWDNDVAAKRSGLGLKNMESRVKLIGASFELISSPGSGTKVRIDKQYIN